MVIPALIALLLIVVAVFLLAGGRTVAGRHYCRFRFFRLARQSGFSFFESRLLFRVFAAVSTTEPEPVFQSETLLIRVLDLFIDEIRATGGPDRDRILARVFRIRHAIVAGLRSGYHGLRNTFALEPGVRFALTRSGGVYPVTLVKREQGYLVCTCPEGEDAPIRKGEAADVTFWIPGECGYRFETEVLDVVNTDGEFFLFLAHGSHLRQVQQRKFHRADCEIDARFETESGQESGRGTVLDISAEGLLLRSEGSFDVGDRFRVVFDLEGQGECRPLARVLGRREGRYHLQFVSAELSDQNRILLYLHRPGR